MATGNKLVLVFNGSNGKETTMSFNYADPEMDASDVRALATGIIANGSIFDNAPLSAVSATLIQTTETAYTLS